MSWSRSTSIVTSLAQVTQLTGKQNLDKVQDDLVGTDLLLSSSKEVYDRLVRDGLDPTKFSADTTDAFERAVAYTFLHHLANHRLIGGDDSVSLAEHYSSVADKQYTNVRPVGSDDSLPSRAGEDLPGITNQGDSFFSPDYFDDQIMGVL